MNSKSYSQQENSEVLNSIVDVVFMSEIRSSDQHTIKSFVNVGDIVLSVKNIGLIVGLFVVSGVHCV